MRTLDRLMAFIVVLLCGTLLFAQTEEFIDARSFAADQWENLTQGEKLAAAATALVSAACIAERIALEVPAAKHFALSLVPYNFSNASAVSLIAMVYRLEKYRSVPYIDIMLYPDYWYQMLGIKDIRR